MAERELEQTAIAGLEPVLECVEAAYEMANGMIPSPSHGHVPERASLFAMRIAGEIGREHGGNGERVKQADGHRKTDRESEAAEELTHHSLHESDGPEDRDDDEGCGDDGEPNLRRAQAGSL